MKTKGLYILCMVALHLRLSCNPQAASGLLSRSTMGFMIVFTLLFILCRFGRCDTQSSHIQHRLINYQFSVDRAAPNVLLTQIFSNKIKLLGYGASAVCDHTDQKCIVSEHKLRYSLRNMTKSSQSTELPRSQSD